MSEGKIHWRGIALLFAFCVTAGTLFPVFAQSSPPSPPAAVMSITPDVAGDLTSRTLDIQALAPSSRYGLVLFAPTGDESSFAVTTSATGEARLSLNPPGGVWLDGLYRVAVYLGGGRAASATFVAGDGHPALAELTDLTSPWSTLYFAGTGLPPNQNEELVVDLTGERGTKTIEARTDANGTLTAFLWPEQLNLPFFQAGYYYVEIPALGLKSRFGIRERPDGAMVTMDAVVTASRPAILHFRNYRANRVLWGVYADSGGHVLGEFLTAPTNASGALDTQLAFPPLDTGSYLLGTPHDWGETAFTAIAPTPTPTATSTPTATATPDPPKKSNKKCNTRKKRAKNKACKAKKKV